MRSIVGDHFRNNVVGYLALFLVLTGGTAYALDGSNTVLSDDIVDGEVRNDDIRSGSVTTGKVANGTLLTEDLALNSVRGDRVADGSLTGADLADRSIGGQKVGVETLAGVNVNDGSLFGEDIADGAIGTAEVATNAVGPSELATGAVGTSELSTGAFNNTDIGPKSAIDPRFEILPSAIQSDEVSDNSITGTDVNESTLDTPEAAYQRADGFNDLPDDSSEEIVASRTVEAGSYIVLAKTSLTSGGGEFVNCRIRALRVGETTTIDQVTNPTVKAQFGLPGAWETVSLLGIYGYSGGSIQFDFICRGDGVTTSNVRLVAMKVNRLIATNAPAP